MIESGIDPDAKPFNMFFTKSDASVASGDVLPTGTPSGCALRLPPAAIRRIVQLLPDRQFWKLFLKAHGRRPQYLGAGDAIAARIFSSDGRVDLGEQKTVVLGET